MDKSFNPCDECDYAFHKQNQESGMCKICEFKQLQESQIDAIELCKIHIALDRLKEYQQLEEQGLLLKLPCKVGDTVWDNDLGRNCSYTITGYSFGKADNYIDEPVTEIDTVYYYEYLNGSIVGSFAASEIGKSVFLTKAEAEQALQRMKEGGM